MENVFPYTIGKYKEILQFEISLQLLHSKSTATFKLKGDKMISILKNILHCDIYSEKDVIYQLVTQLT